VVEGALVLDLFAGTGALGLEALSRGAARAEFFETDRAAVAALRANIAACGASAVVFGDACRVGAGAPAGLVFLDPPYGQGLVDRALAGLVQAGRLAPGCIVVAEVGRDESLPPFAEVLADRVHGAGRMVVGR
jgi:16S rRNA (guanine966-N2)-methyltransferase